MRRCDHCTADETGTARIEAMRVCVERDRARALVRVVVETAGAAGALGWVITDPSGHDVAAGVVETPSAQTREFTAELRRPPAHNAPRRYSLLVGLSVGDRLVDEWVTDFDVGQE